MSFEAFPQATPYQFRTRVNKEELDKKLDDHWNKFAAELPPGVKAKAYKGFRPDTDPNKLKDRIIKIVGGPDQFYETVLTAAVRAESEATKPEQEILAWDSISFKLVSDTEYEIWATGYLEPHVVWTTPVPRFFRAYVKTPSETYVDNFVKAKMDSVKAAHPIKAGDATVEPEENDDLAISAGYNTLAQMKGVFQKEAEDQLVQQQEHEITELVVEWLSNNSQMGVWPSNWRQFKAVDLYQNQVRFYKSEEDFIKASGYKDRESILDVLGMAVLRQAMKHLLLRRWGITNQIEGDTTIPNMGIYSEHCRRLILKDVAVIYLEDAEKAPYVEPNREQAA